MGHIFSPPLDRLAEFCARGLGIEIFVETGTYRGQSVAWAAERFHEVVTIERDPKLYAAARDAAVHGNITFHCGHSPTLLPAIATLPNPKLFWLDAHWCGAWGDSSGVDDQCPVAGELAALQCGTADDVITIDDFHMFATLPPDPFRTDLWPSLAELFSLTQQLPPRNLYVMGNALIVNPQEDRPYPTKDLREPYSHALS